MKPQNNTPQQPLTQDLKQDLKTFQQDLRALRDEVRLKLHLAGMDLKKEWETFEPQVDRTINSAVVVSGEVLSDLKKRLLEFQQRIGRN